jgi:RNA-directed DNA polymerase
MQRVAERISDGRILGLLRSWLAQDILRDTERWTPTEGTPQGAVMAPRTQKVTSDSNGRLRAGVDGAWLI